MTTKRKAVTARGGRKLTPKQKRFVEEYLIDLNATQAAIRAGYSQRTAGQIGEQNLKKLEIKQAIQAAQENRSERTEITQDMVLQELAKIGFSDIRKIVRWGETMLRMETDKDGNDVVVPYHGLALIDSAEIDDATAAAISEVAEGRNGLTVKLHDKKGALVDIGRHLGMFKDRVEHSGPDGGPIPMMPTTIELVAPNVESKD
ncbi:terminase small subunit [Paenalcaligenes hominis]|uniref:Terminase small subunit n=1 Tax=Paenalcaligenes hominis TaxID=643674 RepID=A0A1U9JY99_9BURK|nr:terminase small subunit [Paenalcaligenes hominis]AQS50736.1 terminase small subunit [Paenalcaligenes hominis]